MRVTSWEKLFGTDGIRGKALEYPVTPAVASLLGTALVKLLGEGKGKILIGRDTRESGEALEKGLVEGIRAVAHIFRKYCIREKIAHLHHAAHRLMQRIVKFIRWLKNHLDLERDWEAVMTKLASIYRHS